MGGEKAKMELPLFFRFTETSRKLDEIFAYNENDRKLKVGSILNLYIELVNKFEELAELYKSPLREKFTRLTEE